MQKYKIYNILILIYIIKYKILFIMDTPIGFMGNCVNIANLQIWNRYAILWKKCVIVNLQTWNL